MSPQKSSQITLPSNDEHTTLVASLQQRFTAAVTAENPVDKLLKLHAVAADTSQAHTKVAEDASVFFQNKKDRFFRNLLLGGAVLAAGAVFIAATFSGTAALVAMFGAAVTGLVGSASVDGITTNMADRNFQDFKKSSPILQKIRHFAQVIKNERSVIFETPAIVHAIVESPKFLDALDIASEDEKKILIFAFKSATERKQAWQPVQAPAAYTKKMAL